MEIPPLPRALAASLGLVGLVISLVIIYSGLSSEPDASRGVFTIFGQFGVLEEMGGLFGSLAKVMPEQQSRLAGILRAWAGLFVGCGFVMVVAGGVLGPWGP